MDDVIMFTWFQHRRSTEICSFLGIVLIDIETERTGVLRYLDLTWRSVALIIELKPKTLIIQSPSLVSTIVGLICRPIFGFKLVIDAHNEAVQPYVNKSKIIKWLSRWVIRHADLTIVTNSGLENRVALIGGSAFVIPDRIPELVKPVERRRVDVIGRKRILVIATGAPDEPTAAVVDAASRLPDLVFNVTGRKERLVKLLGENLPENVHLTDFLPESEYWSLLATSDLIVDLTDMEDCLVCGSYEAAAVGTPLVLTRNRASIELYSGHACLVDNNVDEICRGIKVVIDDIEAWQKKIIAFRDEYRRRWLVMAGRLEKRLEQLKVL